jgi:flagellar hook-associated protein 2
MAVDIASALGIGSGINTTQLVADLVNAARSPKENQINTKLTTNNARISALSSAKSSLKTFSDALTQLLQSKEYNGQPSSNDPSIASVTLQTGGVPTGLPAQLEVRTLASAQVLESASLAASNSVAGTGTLTFTLGSSSFDVTLASPTNTLADLASAINAKKAGVTASVVTDKSGARLVLKGETGADQAFTIAAGVDADTDLQRFVYAGTNTATMSKAQSAHNAEITLDGVDMEFATNDVSTAIPFLRIDLNKAAPGTMVTLATTQPTTTISELVKDYVDAYNKLKTALNQSMAPALPASGAVTSDNIGSVGLLSGDNGVREMAKRLSTLTYSKLSNDGPYQTLADLGVSTNRDGTLKLDTTKLDAALKADPEAVTQMINPTVPDTGHPGLAGVLKGVTDYLNGTDGPLASSTKVYDNLKAALDKQLGKLDDDMTTYEQRLTKTYSAMQTRLLALKATQTYLTQQIDVWNNKSN